MKWRNLILATSAIVFFGAVAMAQDATPTPRPPQCLVYTGDNDEVRISYYMGEGLAFLRTNQLSSAERSFTCIIDEIDANFVPAYMYRAGLLTVQRFYERAIEDYSRAIELQPSLVAAYNNRGIVYTAMGELEEANTDFERAIELDPNNMAGYNNRAVYQVISGDLSGAASTLNSAIEISGVDEQLAQLRDPNRPADAPEIRVDPNAARAYALLGLVNTRLAYLNFQDYIFLTGGDDFRIVDFAGSLESRFTFDLRLEDGTWWLVADYSAVEQ
jgi:tetratricopeptide (TPR) repeat protein